MRATVLSWPAACGQPCPEPRCVHEGCQPLGWLCALSVLTGEQAWAAEGGKGASEAIFIGQIVVLMVVGRLLGEAMLRLRQPAVMGQLIAGLILGPSVFGLFLPDLQHTLFRKPPSKKQ